MRYLVYQANAFRKMTECQNLSEAAEIAAANPGYARVVPVEKVAITATIDRATPAGVVEETFGQRSWPNVDTMLRSMASGQAARLTPKVADDSGTIWFLHDQEYLVIKN